MRKNSNRSEVLKGHAFTACGKTHPGHTVSRFCNSRPPVLPTHGWMKRRRAGERNFSRLRTSPAPEGPSTIAQGKSAALARRGGADAALGKLAKQDPSPVGATEQGDLVSF